jgi:prepilin-type N-terminal cleavage/methylation domain-containing protein
MYNVFMQRRGFTLIELLVVISIIALLASTVIAGLSSARDKARLASMQIFSSTLDRALGDEAVAQWDFNDCSGSTVSDVSGMGHAISLSTSPVPTWSSTDKVGDTGCSLVFNGASQLTTGSIPSISLPGQYTLSVWIKRTANSGDQTFLYDGNHRFRLLTTGSNAIRFGFREGANYSHGFNSQNFTLKLNTWTHIAVTYDTVMISLYLDGKLNRTYTPTDVLSTGAATAGLGSAGGNYQAYTGHIDNMRIYNRVITADTVRSIYANEKLGFEKIAKH